MFWVRFAPPNQHQLLPDARSDGFREAAKQVMKEVKELLLNARTRLQNVIDKDAALPSKNDVGFIW